MLKTCEHCEGEKDRDQYLDISLMKDHIKGKSQNSVSKDSKQHVNFVTEAVKESRIDNLNIPFVKDHVEVFNLKTQKLNTTQHVNLVAAAVTENCN